ncbi:MAG: DUF1624 domain-containing protein [Clostridia bacterium]|nr:DUF1624 domain-containing protein [Clostridia bacterium]
MTDLKTGFPNAGRQFEIDLIKAFSIITMIVCHVFDLMTTAGVNDDLLKHVIYYLGNSASGLFIFCMGIGMVYTSRSSPDAFAKRGVKLMLEGYLLNFAKDVLPSLIFTGFNVKELAAGGDLYLVFTTEILQFAGLTFLLTALLKKLRFRPWAIALTALVMQLCASTFLTGAFDGSPTAVRYLAGTLLFTGSTSITMYPLFPFFIYAASGMLFGGLLKRTANKRRFYIICAACGAAVCAAASVIFRLTDFDITDYLLTDMYHSQILPAAVWYISQEVVWAALFFAAAHIVKGRAKKGAEYLSRNITNIYVLQWPFMLIGYIAVKLSSGGLLHPAAGAPLSVAVCLLTVGASLLWNRIKKAAKCRKPGEKKDRAAAG